MSSSFNTNQQYVSVAGNGNGPFINGNGNIVGSFEPPPQSYSRKNVRLLPITERALGVLSAVLAVVTFTTGYASVRELVNSFPGGDGSTQFADTQAPIALYLFGGCILVLAVLLAIWRALRRNTQHFSRFPLVPSLAGVRDGSGRRRIALVRNQGQCEKNGCSGKLKFYAKATAWEDGKVIERTPVAECKRNPKHVFEIDSADTADLIGSAPDRTS